METLNGIEEAGWYAEGTGSNLGFLHLHWLGKALWFLPGKETGRGKNQGVNNFGPLILLDIFPLPLSASCMPPGVQGRIPVVVGATGL